MAILITGAGGYIGSHTCVELLNSGKDLVALDNYRNSKPESLNRVEQITGRAFPCYSCDIRDKAALREIFAKHPIETVIHFAGLKAVAQSCVEPLAYYDNNVGGMVALLEVMAEAGVKRMVFSSSATVYGRNPFPYTEEMPTGDVSNPYGRTKYFIEEILKDLYASDSEWSIVMLRYFNPVGAHPSGLIGDDPNGVPNNLMPYITRVAVGRLPSLPVTGTDFPTPDGTGVRDYIHVVDLARGHMKAVEYTLTHTGAEAVNLGSGKGTSVLELVHAFEKASGKTIPLTYQPRRPGDLPEFYAATDKAARLLDFHAEKSIGQMCADAWHWQMQNPDGL